MARPVEAIYLFDPLCGWCYGAAPRIGELARQPGIALDLVPVGLFADAGAFTITPASERYIQQADARIAEITGQTFSETYRRNVATDAFSLVDSSPATLALTALRLRDPAGELGLLKLLQQARYVSGVNISTPEALAEVLVANGLADISAQVSTGGEALLQANRKRIESGRDLMRRFDLRGVPALLAGRDGAFNAIPSSLLFGPLSDALAALG